MANKHKKEIRELSTRELKDLLNDEKDNLTRMRLAHAVSPVDSPVKLRYKKRLVAAIHTEIRARELGISESEVKSADTGNTSKKEVE
jgi:large subunit ribosomal protein L29